MQVVNARETPDDEIWLRPNILPNGALFANHRGAVHGLVCVYSITARLWARAIHLKIHQLVLGV